MSGACAVRDAFAVQAVWCARLGSPFTARLLEGLGPRLGRGSVCERAMLDWQGDPGGLGDAVPLRLAGALHMLVRRGRVPALAKLYPPQPLPETQTLADAALAAMREADADITACLAFAPQTNEVARSAVLYPGLMRIAAETRCELDLYEIGSSAGLNLVLDRYAYRLGERTCGRRGSPLVLSPKWRGASPVGPEPVIAFRRGCDLNPIDLADEAASDRLVGYIWPDQEARIERIEAAIELAREDLPPLKRADAAGWVERWTERPGEPGRVRVLLHSIMFQYLPGDARARIGAAMARAGDQATVHTPLAWLAFEQEREKGPCLSLRLWPGRAHERVLAAADPHVSAVEWR